MIEVLTNGALNIVVDHGRTGLLAQGISRSGPMDAHALSIANALVGNGDDAAAVEVSVFPFRVRFEQDVRFACTGADAAAKLAGRATATWWSRTALAGQVLAIEPPRVGARVYFACEGGITVPPVLGSRTTDLKAPFGGFEGRGLRKGDRLPIGNAATRGARLRAIGARPSSVALLHRELAARQLHVRVHRHAEFDRYCRESQDAFTGSDYTVTRDADRMGCRLQGAELQLKKSVDLFSHGIVPGTIQVPPSGQPVVQLAAANTCGGYPKIGAVIEADLWRMGQATPGSRVRFHHVDHGEAVAALAELAAERQRLRDLLDRRDEAA